MLNDEQRKYCVGFSGPFPEGVSPNYHTDIDFSGKPADWKNMDVSSGGYKEKLPTMDEQADMMY